MLKVKQFNLKRGIARMFKVSVTVGKSPTQPAPSDLLKHGNIPINH